ncbi:MAG: DMT family transporter [Anaerolineae bacterium]|nr:DMT family transporter [Anaerolineae bacterium]
MKIAKNSPNYLSFIVIAIGILAVSSSSLIIRSAQKEVPSLVIAAARLSIAAIILGIIVLFKNKNEIKLLGLKQFFLLVLSGIFLAGHFATWITSLEYTSIASSVVLVCSTPLWVALLSPIFIKEKPGKTLWAGMGLTLIGAVVVGLSGSLQITASGPVFSGFKTVDQSRALFGNFLALLGAWSETGYILIGRGLRRKISIMPYTFLVYGSAAVVLLIIVFATGLSITGYSPIAYFWLAALAIVPQLIGHTSFNWALGYLNAAFVSVALLGEPVGTTILSYIILKESPTIIEMVGGILILMGIYITSQAKNSNNS